MKNALSPLFLLHLGAGSLALVSGTAALAFRKGSRPHRATGNVFVLSMLALAVSGAYIGFVKHQTLNGMMGVLTTYLVATAWWTAKNRTGRTGAWDYGAFLVPLAVGACLVSSVVKRRAPRPGRRTAIPPRRTSSSALWLCFSPQGMCGCCYRAASPAPAASRGTSSGCA